MEQISENLLSYFSLVSTVLFLLVLGLYLRLIHKIRQKAETKSEAPESEKDTLSLRRFKMAVDKSTDGIVITNKAANIIYVNEAWEKLTGYKSEEALGKNPRILKSGKTKPEIYEKMWSTLNSNKPFVTEDLLNKRKNGSTYQARLEVYPITESGVTMYVGIENDISERTGAEKAKTEFVSLASHQLRTPLSVIDWYTETLLSGSSGPLNGKQQMYVEELYKTNQHMMNLVDMLLNTSRLELGTFAVAPEPTNLVQIGRDVIKELKPKIDTKGLKIITELGEDVPTIRVDKNIMRIVLQNIISNAIQYTPSEGTVWFSMQLMKSGSRVKDRYIASDSIVITVQDSGIGIPQEEQGKIFSKLYRASNAREHRAGGTGLGLYIVKSILDQTNGLIWFESEKGVGSTFYVAIPVRGMHSGEKISVIKENT